MNRFELVIGPAERDVLRELVRRATASPTDYATMKKIADAHAAGAQGIAEMNRALTVEIPTAYTVTLTLEEHRPGVMCRHVSIGLRTRPGRGPTPEAVRALLPLVGFINTIGTCATWTEPLDDGTFAVNLVEPISGQMSELAAP